MAKFYGQIGFAITEEVRPGVWEQTIVEREYYGDVVNNTYRYSSSDKVNDDLTISSNISIVADSFANENLGTMKYIKFMGTNWKIESVEPVYPRLTLRLGGVYNGPAPKTA